MSNYSVYVGAIGWKHAQWSGDFYPEDMPEDWQLAFYNTQFRCVYLPHVLWSTASDDEVSFWLGETQEGFRFVLEAPDIVDEKSEQKAGSFGKRGIDERRIELIWLEGKPDLRGLVQRMQKAAQSGSALFIISRDGSLSQLRQIKELMEVLGV